MYRAYRGSGLGKTDPQCGTVQFCSRSGRLTCSARTGFKAVTTPLGSLTSSEPTGGAHNTHRICIPENSHKMLYGRLVLCTWVKQ